VNVRFVVIASADEAAKFCSQFGDARRCLSDPEKTTYKAMGLEDTSLFKLFTDPDLRRRRKENKAAGFRQNWRATKLANGMQLPGAAVIDASSEVRWTHRGKHPGDLPPMREMLEIAQRVLASACGRADREPGRADSI
jgi:hypothetical protein